ncbi:MAG: DUF975 family protein [Acetanaerobacterium sp.]
MWERSFLKQNAKLVLKTNYWMAFAVCLVAGILTGSGGSSSGGSTVHNQLSGTSVQDYGSQIWDLLSGIGLATIILVSLFSVLFVTAYLVFIVNPIQVGKTRYFVQSRLRVSRFSLMFSSFQRNAYLGAVKTMVLRDVFLFLWYLLLIIPGIIKSYAYRMVPYILADNPNIGASRAIELSNQMTKDEKLEIFVLDLSFLGWILLGVLACGVGVLFVSPYIEATNAELYAMLKDKAYRTGLCTPAELGEQYPQQGGSNYTL